MQNGGMPCWRSQKQRDHQIDNNTAVRFRVEKLVTVLAYNHVGICFHTLPLLQQIL